MTKGTIEDSRGANYTQYKDVYNLTLYSKTKGLDEIMEWSSEIIVKQYSKYVKLKTIENRNCLLSVSYQDKLIVESSNLILL